MKHRGIVWMTAAALAALFAVGSGAVAQNKSPEDLFKQRCVSCHGADGKGASLGKNLGVKDWTNAASLKGMSDADLEKIIKEGKKGADGKAKMPAYPSLTADQIKGLVKVVRSFSAKK